jgi:hypothetical protein
VTTEPEELTMTYSAEMDDGMVVRFVETETPGVWEARAQPWDNATNDWSTSATYTEMTFRVFQEDGDDADWEPTEAEVLAAYHDAKQRLHDD